MTPRPPIRRLYRRRPILVEAVQINADDWDSVDAVAEWCEAEIIDHRRYVDQAGTQCLHLGDDIYANDHDWIVRLGTGEYVVVADRTFQAQYEPIGVFQ